MSKEPKSAPLKAGVSSGIASSTANLPASGAWVLVGVGPMTVELITIGQANVALANSTPNAADAGASIQSGMGTAQPAFLKITQGINVYARSATKTALKLEILPDVTSTSAAAGGSGYASSGIAPVTGSIAAGASPPSTGVSQSFAPLAGRAFNVSIFGTFTGVAQLERSFDGTTWLPLTAGGAQVCQWPGPCSESVHEDEAGVLYRINFTEVDSGTANYRLSQ